MKEQLSRRITVDKEKVEKDRVSIAKEEFFSIAKEMMSLFKKYDAQEMKKAMTFDNVIPNMQVEIQISLKEKG